MIRTIWLVTLLALTLPAHCPAQDEGRVRSEEPAIREREKRIDAELAALDRRKLKDDDWAKEWAGTYYTGDGLGMNVTIKLAPKAGLTYTWHGCMGLYDGDHGDIVETFPDGIRVKLALGGAGPYNYMSERLYFVCWGDRRYLVPKAQMMKLVHDYNEGGFARDEMYSIPRQFKERPRENTSTEGASAAPAEYAKLLLTRPITLTVTSVVAQEPTGVTGQVKMVTASLSFDAGTDKGVFKGMSFSYQAMPSFGKIEITEVEEHACKGKITMFGSDPQQMVPPRVGTALTYPEPDPRQEMPVMNRPNKQK